MNRPRVTAEASRLVDGAPSITVKIQTDEYELNVWIQERDVPRLRQLANYATDTPPQQIGESAGAPVHWSIDGDTVNILVGDDPVTWDFGISMTRSTLRRLVDELGSHARQ